MLMPRRTRSGVLLLLLLLARIVGGTITVIDTGEHFASRQDEDYGPELWKGYHYASRLQRIDGNLSLCPPGENDDDDNKSKKKKHHLVIPSDGSSVALLARDGGCSRLEKINYIRDYVEPAHLVHYLIMDGDTSEQHHHHHRHHLFGWAPSLQGMADPVALAQQQQGEEYSVDEDSDDESSDDEDSDDENLEKRDESIPIFVLHVSYRSEYKLLDYLLHQTTTTREEGGPRLAIDSRVNVNRISDNVALAIAALTLLAACSCSLGLLIHGNRSGWWEPPPPAPPAPRQNRRRLRRDQVKEMLPVYRFNGRELEIIPEETIPTTTVDEEGCLCEGPPRVPPLLPAELDCCSICLDDYEEGDRIRCIEPCNHTYHAKCIGKWLVERSATCPLCKHDLYESEDEEEEEEEEEGEASPAEGGGVTPVDPENAGITHFQAQLPAGMLGQQEEAAARPRLFWPFAARSNEERPAEQEPAPAALQDQQQNGDETQEPMRAPRARRGWWQRLFRGREPAVESLTEPLLEEQPTTAPDVESPPPAEEREEEEVPEPVESSEDPSPPTATSETAVDTAE